MTELAIDFDRPDHTSRDLCDRLGSGLYELGDTIARAIEDAETRTPNDPPPEVSVDDAIAAVADARDLLLQASERLAQLQLNTERAATLRSQPKRRNATP